jgi:hypothetical protein
MPTCLLKATLVIPRSSNRVLQRLTSIARSFVDKKIGCLIFAAVSSSSHVLIFASIA